MARTKVTWSDAATQEILDGGNGVREMLAAKAGRVLAAAQAGAPVATGEYRDGLHIIETHTDRLVFRVSGSTDHDWAVEAKTGNLARSLDAARGS